MEENRPMFCQNPTDPIDRDCPDCVDAVIDRAREYERRLKKAAWALRKVKGKEMLAYEFACQTLDEIDEPLEQ
jgi:hypothetical protein